MMKSFQLYHLQLLYLLIAALFECEVVTQRRCKQVHHLNINCVQGDNMSISCLTTTHPLQSLTVKLHRTNQDKDILMYPDISPEPEQERWSVRKDAGNVTLDLKDIRLSDDGLYDCQVYKNQDCLNVIRFNLKVKECKILDSVHPKPGSSVLLPCSEHPLQHRTEQVTWKVVNGRQSTDITQYSPPNRPSSSTDKLLKPLYERVRQLKNGSLLISDVVHTDELWYRCSVNEKNCYDVKLLLKVCKILDSVHPTPGSSVLLPCSEHPLQRRAERVTWKIVNGHQLTDITQYSPPNNPSSSTENLLKPLYERVTQLKNGSLLIKDVVHTDELWYQCRVNEKTCYEVKLLLKVITDPTPADSMVFQTEDYNTDKSETVTTNVTVVVMITVVSLCVLISLTVSVILYFKKPRPEIDNQTESNGQSPVYYSEVSVELDGPVYSVVQHKTKRNHLRCEETEAAYNPDIIYDNRML